MHVLHNIFVVVINTSAYHFGPIQPSSPSTKELRELALSIYSTKQSALETAIA